MMTADSSLSTRLSLLEKLRDLDDQKSWQEFYDRYQGFLEALAKRHELSTEDVEEVIQETVVAFARKIGDFVYDRDKGRLRSWLATIVRRKVVDKLRDRAKAKETTLWSREEEAYSFERFDVSWEEEWERHALDRAKVETLKKVTNKQFQLYDWYVLRGHSKADVCEKFQVTGNQVDIAKHRVGKVMEEEVRKLRDGVL